LGGLVTKAARFRAWYRDFERSSDAYGVVVLLLIVLIILPMAVELVGKGVVAFATAVVAGAVVVLTLRASWVRPWLVNLAAVIWVTAVVGAVLPERSVLETIGGVGLGLLLIVSPGAILNRIVRHKRVTVKTVYGSIAVYLQIGVAYSLLYLELFRVDPATYPSVSDGTLGTFIYYSFVTLTTVGYGDITPVTEAGRTLAIFEALIGQIFLVIVVARIVALLGSEARLKDSNPEE
jgi:hypothetical protein